MTLKSFFCSFSFSQWQCRSAAKTEDTTRLTATRNGSVESGRAGVRMLSRSPLGSMARYARQSQLRMK